MAVIGKVAAITSDFQGVRITLNREYRSEELVKCLSDYEEAMLLELYTKFFKAHREEEIQELLKKKSEILMRKAVCDGRIYLPGHSKTDAEQR